MNLEMKFFIESFKFDIFLEFCYVFFGGCINVVFFYKYVNENEKIYYVDFIFLYLWINKYCEILIQYFEILISEVLINCLLCEFFGLIKCDIFLFIFLFYFVLFYCVNGKLMFFFCRICVEIL